MCISQWVPISVFLEEQEKGRKERREEQGRKKRVERREERMQGRENEERKKKEGGTSLAVQLSRLWTSTARGGVGVLGESGY